MAKIDPLIDVVNLQSETSAVQILQENNDKVTSAFENTVSRDGSTPNDMQANMDMGGFRITNCSVAVDANDVVTKSDLDAVSGGLDAIALTNVSQIVLNANAAASSAASAAASATAAANYIGAATTAAKWTTARTITFSGGLSGTSPAFDGSANVTFTATVADGTITGAKLAAGAVASNLGFTPVGTTGAVFTGPVRLNYVASVLTQDAAGFRVFPTVTKDTDYIFVVDDAGKMFKHTSGTGNVWYVPTDATAALPIGTAITVRNQGSGVVTIAPENGSLALRLAGSSTFVNVHLVQWGAATLVKEEANAWFCIGVGISG